MLSSVSYAHPQQVEVGTRLAQLVNHAHGLPQLPDRRLEFDFGNTWRREVTRLLTHATWVRSYQIVDESRRRWVWFSVTCLRVQCSAYARDVPKPFRRNHP